MTIRRWWSWFWKPRVMDPMTFWLWGSVMFLVVLQTAIKLVSWAAGL